MRCTTRKKNAKEHRYWSLVENKRCAGDKIVQRHVLYLGEINDAQQAAWQKTMEIFAHGQTQPRTVGLFPEDRALEVQDAHIVRVKLCGLHDLIGEHKAALFDHLTRRWKDLFNAQFDVLLYDLTSTYCEGDPPFPEDDKRKFGYSRDKCPDCVQVVIALIVTPEGFPLAYEVMPGNTGDKTTLKAFWSRSKSSMGRPNSFG